MAFIGVGRIQVDLSQLSEAIKDFITGLKDFRPLWRDKIHPSTVRFFQRQFRTEGREGGDPWAPLRPATIRIKRDAGRSRMGVLRFSNELWASLTKLGGPKAVVNISKKAFERGTSVQSGGVPYPALQQEGFTIDSMFGRPLRTRVQVPARKIVPDEMPVRVIREWESLTAKFLEEKK